MVYWSKMTARQVWDALNDAPAIAGPWVESGTVHVRKTPDGGWVCTDRGQGNGVTMHAFDPDEEMLVDHYPDRASADAALRAAGWLVVD